MDVYIYICVFLVICVFLRKYFSVLDYFSFALCFIVLACRDFVVGTDTLNYIYDFQGFFLSSYDFSWTTEFGYVAIVLLLKFLNFEPFSIVVFFAFASFYFLYLSFSRFKIPLSLGVYFFIVCGFYLSAFNISRQILGCCIFLYALSFICIDNSSKKKYWLFFTVAIMFHKSLWFFVWLYFVPNKAFKLWIIYLSVLISIVIFWFEFNFINSLLVKGLGDFYSNYSSILTDNFESSLMGKIFFVIITFVQLFIMYDSKDRINPRLYNLFAISIVVFLLTKNLHPYLSRIALGITIIQIVFYSKYFQLVMVDKLKKDFVFLFITILLLYGQYSLLVNNIGEVVPYRIHRTLNF